MGDVTKNFNKSYHVSTIQRAIEVLNLFKTHRKLSFTKIQESLLYSKSTLFRVLYTLEKNRYLMRDQHGFYELGINVFILGNVVSKVDAIKRTASSYLEDLSEKSGNAIHIGILNGLDVVIIDKYEPLRGIKMVSRIGASVPPHCTGQGKVLLAHSSKDLVLQIVEHHGLKKYTSNTITSLDDLLEELLEVKRRGFAIDDSEHEEHIKCISVPVRGVNGEVEAALSMTGLTVDFGKGKGLDDKIAVLLENRNKIEAKWRCN